MKNASMASCMQSKPCFVPGSAPSTWKDVYVLGRKIDDSCKLSYI